MCKAEERAACILTCATAASLITDITRLEARCKELDEANTGFASHLIDLMHERDEAQEALAPFCDPGPRGESALAVLERYETTLMNEDRLYDALGKEDARSVLVIWERFRSVVEHLAPLGA